MITYFKASNIFNISSDKPLELIFENNLAMFVGSNASGKSNILKSLDFINDFLSQKKIASDVKTFKFNSEVTTIAIEIKITDKKYYFYELKINLNDKSIKEETLYCSDKNIYEDKLEENLIFKRENNKFNYLKDDSKDIKHIKEIPSTISSIIYIGELKLSKTIEKFYNFFKNKIFNTINNSFANIPRKFSPMVINDIFQNSSEDELDIISNFLNRIDIGIEKITYKNIKNEMGEKNRIYQLFHKDLNIPIPLHYESDGTITSLGLIREMFVLDKKTIIYDEIEKNIHPFLVTALITEYLKENRGQLIFSTHSLELLNSIKDTASLFFVGKEKDGSLLCANLKRDFNEEDFKKYGLDKSNIYDNYYKGILGFIPKTEIG